MADERRLWKWVELPRFAGFCREISDKLGIAYEGDFDEIRWAIEENICRNPFGVSHPDPRFEGVEEWRYFRILEAPGRIALPPLVATFRIASYPTMGTPGLIEGREVWIESELRAIGVALSAA